MLIVGHILQGTRTKTLVIVAQLLALVGKKFGFKFSLLLYEGKQEGIL